MTEVLVKLLFSLILWIERGPDSASSSILSMTLISLLMFALAVLSKFKPSSTLASTSAACIYQCDTSTYGYDEQSWPIVSQSYGGGSIGCSYGTTTPSESSEEIGCALNAVRIL
jgi:hypothetical protein